MTNNYNPSTNTQQQKPQNFQGQKVQPEVKADGKTADIKAKDKNMDIRKDGKVAGKENCAADDASCSGKVN